MCEECLTSQMSLDKGGLASTSVSDQHQFEGGHVLSSSHDDGQWCLVSAMIGSYNLQFSTVSTLDPTTQKNDYEMIMCDSGCSSLL